jgi:hypothetical protein
VDLEHWAAFQEGFRAVAEMVTEVASGLRGPAPDTVTFLSGDVHHSYVSEVKRPRRSRWFHRSSGFRRSSLSRPSRSNAPERTGTRIVQAVCSPIRNPLPQYVRFATAFLSYGLAGPIGAVVVRSAKVRNPPFRWRNIAGPWFDNNLATLEDRPEGLSMRWERGVVADGDHEHPRLEQVASVLISRSGGAE